MKKFFGPSEASVWSKSKRGPGPGPLPSDPPLKNALSFIAESLAKVYGF